jgi:PAS domain S-box-containing protein
MFRAVLESLQTGVCVVDRERKITFWNDGAEKITVESLLERTGNALKQAVAAGGNSAIVLCAPEPL